MSETINYGWEYMLSNFLGAVFFLTVITNQAIAKSWNDSIEDVTELAERYREEADAKSGDERLTKFLGTVHSVQDIEMHMCAILGRRMGHTDAIHHLEPSQPSLDSDLRVLLDNYASLLSWIRAAQRFGSMSQHQRALHWNLECVGEMGIAGSLGVRVPPATFYEVDGDYITVFGDIIPGYADKLKEVLLKHPEVSTVWIGSGGGAVYEAMSAGQIIRGLNISTQSV